MPFKSQAQAAYFNSHKQELEAQGVDVAEWNSASKGMKLPQKVSKPQKPHRPAEHSHHRALHKMMGLD